MTSTPSPTAGDVYEHELTASRGGRVRRALSGVANAVVNVEGGPLELASVGDVVVRRRADGVEVLRVPAGPSEEAALTLEEIEEQLRSVTPDAFRERWGIDS